MPSALRRALPLLSVTAVWAALSHRVWALQESYYLRDFWVNYVPTRTAMREALLSGDWFLWNRWIGGGLPSVPDPCTSVFYPPSWPFLLLADQGFAYSLLVGGHLLLAWGGTYLLARRWVEVWPAVAAGASWALGGLLLSNLSNGQFQLAYAWAPMWFAAFLSLLDRVEQRRPPWLMAAAVAGIWALQLLASDPQIVYQQGLAIPLLLVGRWWEKRPPSSFVARSLWVSALAVLGAVALALPQLWPMFESLSQIDRQSLSAEEAAQWSLHPLRLWELVLPLPWGELTPVTTFWGKALVVGPFHNFYFGSLYLSALVIPLALLGTRGLGRGALVVAAGALVLVLASLGEATFLHRGLRSVLPLWEVFRYPERLLVLPSLGLALLLGRGIAAAQQLERRRLLPWVALPLGVATVAWLLPGWVGPGGESELAREAIATSVSHVWMVGVAVMAVLFLREQFRGVALSAVVMLELLAVGLRIHATWKPPSPPHPWAQEPGRLLVVIQDVAAAGAQLPPEPAQRRGLEDFFGRPNLGAMRGVRNTNAVSSLRLIRANQLMRALGIEEAAHRYATSALVGRAGLPLRNYRPESDLGHGLALYRPRTPVEEVRCLLNWERVESTQQSLEVVRRGGTAVEGGSPPTATGAVPCRLTRVSDRELKVEFSPQPHPMLVAISESYYPGWQVLAGSTDPVLPVDVAFLGAVVSPGQSELRLRYQPRWLAPSLAVSGLSVLLLLALVVHTRRRPLPA